MKEHRAEDAERHARDLVGLAERAWGESAELIRALDVLAMALRHSKPKRDPSSLAEQLALHERALQITAALRGPDHFENALALLKVGMLGRALLDAGRGEEASRSLRVALGIAESLDPRNARLIEELRAWLAEPWPSPR